MLDDVWLGLLVPVKQNLYATEYNDFLYNVRLRLCGNWLGKAHVWARGS